MSGKVLHFRSAPTALAKPPAVASLLAATRLAVENSALHFDGPRLKGRMIARGISMTLVIEALKSGGVVSSPKLDKYGEWTIEIRRHVAGRTVQVKVAFGPGHVSVVNVL